MPEAQVQGESQGLCGCEVADESVVVSKAWPVKPSNGVEDKTEPTISKASDGVLTSQKRSVLRREEVHFKSVLSRCFFFVVPKLICYRGIPSRFTVEAGDWSVKPYRGVVLSLLSKLPLS